jgi:hypothetical protein
LAALDDEIDSHGQARGNLYCEHSEHEGEALAAFADGGGDASPSNRHKEKGNCRFRSTLMEAVKRRRRNRAMEEKGK